MNKLAMLSISVAGALCSGAAWSVEVYKSATSTASIGGYFNIDVQQSDGDTNLENSNSRINFGFTQELTHGWRAKAFTEWKVNLVSNEDSLGFQNGGDSLDSSAKDFNDTINIRHGWIGLYHDKWGSFSAGKQWSAYYDVTASTDMMLIWGGNASGTYNYGTDGGLSGTGRAEKSIIYRNSWGDTKSDWGSINIAAQYQAKSGHRVNIYECQRNPMIPCDSGNLGDPVSSFKYDYSAGFAVTYAMPWNVSVGAAYNRSELDGNPDVAGFDDDYEDAWAIGAVYGKPSDKFYIAANYYEGDNHEFDNNGIIYDSKGTEVYAAYSINSQWKVVAAYNNLKPNDDSEGYDGDFEIKYYAAGLQYYWTDHFWIFTEMRFEDSTNADDTEGNAVDDPDSVYALSLRYYF